MIARHREELQRQQLRDLFTLAYRAQVERLADDGLDGGNAKLFD